jgi:adenosine deaminase
MASQTFRSDAAMQAFIRGIPKAELHIHIEGSLEPEMVFQLARKHAMQLDYPSVQALRDAYSFHDLQSFLDIYYAGASVLRDEKDFYAMTWAYLQRARDQGVVHAEMFFDPQTHTERGVPFAVVVNGIHRALQDGSRQYGISHRLILCFLRHLTAEAAMATLDEALLYKDKICAVGLDSSELGHPPEKFKDVFQRARAAGFAAVAHAGEEGPPAYIYAALDALKVSRIDHGVRCEEDASLCRRLAEEGIPLTVCPLSNVKLGVYQNLEDHNLKRLLDQGICVTVNSDDPAYFGGYIADNYIAVQQALGLSPEVIVQLARNSIIASFMTEAEKKPWLDRIDVYATATAS